MRYYYLLLTSLLFVTCLPQDGRKIFDIPIEVDITAPAGLNTIDTHVFTYYNIPTKYALFLNGVLPDNVNNVLAENAVMSPCFDEIDWSVIREISIHAISAVDSDIKKEIYYFNLNDQKGKSELRLIRSLSNVKEIIEQDAFHIEVRIRFAFPPPTELETRLSMNFIATDNN